MDAGGALFCIAALLAISAGGLQALKNKQAIKVAAHVWRLPDEMKLRLLMPTVFRFYNSNINISVYLMDG
jgi:hypothetical protein